MCLKILTAMGLFSFLFAGSGQAQVDNPVFSFGLISDVQYADVESLGKRNYRAALPKLENTLEVLNTFDLEFTVNLGDLIDRDFESFDKPLKILKTSKAPLYHVWGNHDFSVDDDLKSHVGEKLGNTNGYHAFEVQKFVFLVLNGMDISLEGHPENSPNYKLAKKMMEELEAGGANNAKPYNGGIGEEQLNWLIAECEKANDKGKKVLVFCHYPLFPENGLQLLNNQEVYQQVSDIPALVGWFSGHHHEGNYLKDKKGIHHLTFKGLVEAESEALGAVIGVYQNKITIQSIGQEEDRVLEFR